MYIFLCIRLFIPYKALSHEVLAVIYRYGINPVNSFIYVEYAQYYITFNVPYLSSKLYRAYSNDSRFSVDVLSGVPKSDLRNPP